MVPADGRCPTNAGPREGRAWRAGTSLSGGLAGPYPGAARQPVYIALGVVFLVGLALRLYFIWRWRPALIGFPDTSIYIEDALTGIFNDPLRVGGYSEFLRLMHGIRPHLSFAIFVQHLLGLASGLLLFGAVRRAGLSGWVALVPAAVVMLGGSEIFVEHAPLSEAVFIFLVDLALYAIVRAWKGSWGWAALAGLALGAATDVRSLGLVLLFVMIVVATLTTPGAWRRRVVVGAVMLVAAALPIGGFLHAHEQAQGYGGFTGAGYFDLYARVAPFAELLQVHPSRRHGRPLHSRSTIAATRARLLGVHRRPHPPYRYSASPTSRSRSPGRTPSCAPSRRPPSSGSPSNTSNTSGATSCGSSTPSFPSSPYGDKGPTGTGYGNTPQSLIDYYLNTSTSTRSTQFSPRTTRGTAKSTRVSPSCSTTSATPGSRGR